MRTRSLIPTSLRPGGALPIALGAVACAGAILISLSAWAPGSSGSWASSGRLGTRSVPSFMLEPTAMQLEVALRRAGITPESLAAAGLSGGEVTSLVSAGRAYLSDHQADLETADGDAGGARSQRDALARLAAAGLATENDLAALAAAEAALASAVAARDQVLADLSDAALSGLGAGPRAVIAQIAANPWDLPTPYLAAGRGQAQWVDLRDDLANLRISAELGEEPDPGCVQDVATANADPSVSAAATNLANGLAEVAQAWSAAIGA